jgi:hypothetical protein
MKLKRFATLLFVLSGASAASAKTIVVDSTADAGRGSLRSAIETANARLGPNTITFDLPSWDRTIRPESALPVIIDSLTIDGGAKVHEPEYPMIELDGSLAPNAVGLEVWNQPAVIRGLVINRFGIGVYLLNTPSVVEDCRIGTDATGLVELPGTSVGVLVRADGATVRRNLISGSRLGVRIQGSWGSAGNRIEDNVIGPDVRGLNFDATGSSPLQELGIELYDTTNNLVSGNLISALWWGIRAYEGGANRIVNNFIGMSADGSLRLGRIITGITLNQTQGDVVGGVGKLEANRVGFHSTGLGLILPRSVVARGNRFAGVSAGGFNVRGIAYLLPPNPYERTPAIASARADGLRLDVAATVTGPPGTTYDVDFYSTPNWHGYSGFSCDAQRYLGAVSVTLGPSGTEQALFTRDLDEPVEGFVTATVTARDGLGSTSALADCHEVLTAGGGA